MMALPNTEKVWRYVRSFIDTMPYRDGRTDRRTEVQISIVLCMIAHGAHIVFIGRPVATFYEEAVASSFIVV